MAVMTFIQLGRYGDLLNILPLWKHLHDQGNTIGALVSPEFANLLEGVSYVQPLPCRFHQDDAPACERWAVERFHNVCRCQVWKNDRPMEAKNFTLKQWAYVGRQYLPLYQKLPLVFDRRNPERERALICKLNPCRQTILYNFAGISSPFIDHRGLRVSIHGAFPDANLVDLSRIRAHRLYDLVGLYERADALVTVDTATLHLANATRTPTVALSLPTPFLQSETRDFWIGHFDYTTYDVPTIIRLLKSACSDSSACKPEHTSDSPTVQLQSQLREVDNFSTNGALT